jgi:Cu2+-exporting ATPase
VNCAGCIAKIEAHLARQDGVILARGNATLKRMRLVWNPEQQTADGLIRAIISLGYGAHPFDPDAGVHEEPSLLPQLGVAGFATMNIMAISFAVWAGLATDMGAGSVQFLHWVSAFLATPVVIYSAAVFYRPSLRALVSGHMTMDTPISLAVWITYLASLFETMRGSDHVYFDAVAALVFFLLIGRVMERALKRRSGDAAQNLRNLMRLTARRCLQDGGVEEIPADHLVPNDIVIVESGERAPADGLLLSAHAQVDESVITGEILPRDLIKGDAIAAGAIIYAGPVQLRVLHVGEDAQVGRISQMIDDAAAHKGGSQLLADRFARGYIPIVLGGGLFGFVLWYFLLGASFADALMIAVAVLVVTCPCAAGLATPAVSSRAVNILMQKGIVVKSGDALERLGEVDQVIADKTGTLSMPLPQLEAATSHATRLQAASLAIASRHPLAQALCSGLDVHPLPDLTEVPGQGIQSATGARLGSAIFVGATATLDPSPTLWFRNVSQELCKFTFQETPRAGLAAFCTGLGAMNIPVTVLSGDTPASVGAFAERVGLLDWHAAATPENKLAHLQSLVEAGHKPLMFGDGINDAPALRGAYTSASFASATEVAQVAADLILTRPAPELIPEAIMIAQQARRLILQNLRFSAVYNIVTVPLALAGLLNPIVAAILMSSSSIIVLANGLRLRGAK